MILPFAEIEHYDARPFAFARSADGFNMDTRHLQVLYAIAAEIHPRCVLEIGSYRGYSSAAFVSLLNAGFTEEAHFVEPHVNETLRCVLAHARISKRVHLHETFADNAPIIDADFWLIDGDHGDAALRDLDRAFRHEPTLIALHDTNPAWENIATAGREAFRGSIEAAARLAHRSEYLILRDHAKRPGENTDRGLTIGLRKDHVTVETIGFAAELLKTDHKWWKE